MKGLKGIITAGVFLLLLTGAGSLYAVDSSFFTGGISVSPKVQLFIEEEFATQFTWKLAFLFGKDIVLNQTPYYGDAWKFFLDFGGRYYFVDNNITGYFVNANIEGGILDLPYYIAFPGMTTTNRYKMEPSFGYQVGMGYRWYLGGSRILDLSFMYAIEFSLSYNGLFIVSSYEDLRMSHWFQLGIDFIIGFPSQLPKTPKVDPKLPLDIPKTNLSGAGQTNTMNTNLSGLMPTNAPALPPQTNQTKPK